MISRWLIVALLISALVVIDSGGAQDSAAKKLSGVVRRLQGKEQVPVPNATVVLHRIGEDSTGVLDSVRTNSAGRFDLNVRPFGLSNARYIITSSHHGVAYIADLGTAADMDSVNADITQFDTTLSAVPVTTLERIVVVFGPAMGTGSDRRVYEVHQIANDSSVTRVSPGPASPTWTTTVPGEAREFMLGTSNANEHALRLDNNVLKMFAPLAPGVVNVEFSYMLPASAFPINTVIAANTERVQVLLEEAGATASGHDLADEGLVTLMGRNYYHRYHGGPADVEATIAIAVPEGGGVSMPNYLTIVVLIIGAGLLVSLAITNRWKFLYGGESRVGRQQSAVGGRQTDHRKEDARFSAVDSSPSTPDSIARKIAALDDAHASQQGGDAAAYKAEREKLKQELKLALARQRKPS